MDSRFRQKAVTGYLRGINWVAFAGFLIGLLILGLFLDNFVEPLLVCEGVFANAKCLAKLLMPGSEDAIKIMVDVVYALIGAMMYPPLKKKDIKYF